MVYHGHTTRFASVLRRVFILKSGLVMSAAAALILAAGCGGGSSPSGDGGNNNTAPAATPTIATSAAQNGAVIVSLADTTSGATIYYTTDGSTPATTSQIYEAPFLVASNLTVKAIATASGDTASTAASQSFSPNIASGTRYGATNSPTWAPAPRGRMRKSGASTRAPADGATMNSKITAPGGRRPRHATPRIPTRSSEPTDSCTLWAARLRGSSRRRV